MAFREEHLQRVETCWRPAMIKTSRESSKIPWFQRLMFDTARAGLLSYADLSERGRYAGIINICDFCLQWGLSLYSWFALSQGACFGDPALFIASATRDYVSAACEQYLI